MGTSPCQGPRSEQERHSLPVLQKQTYSNITRDKQIQVACGQNASFIPSLLQHMELPHTRTEHPGSVGDGQANTRCMLVTLACFLLLTNIFRAPEPGPKGYHHPAPRNYPHRSRVQKPRRHGTIDLGYSHAHLITRSEAPYDSHHPHHRPCLARRVLSMTGLILPIGSANCASPRSLLPSRAPTHPHGFYRDGVGVGVRMAAGLLCLNQCQRYPLHQLILRPPGARSSLIMITGTAREPSIMT